ncbi:Protein IN2-1 [Datura stramonium]|uniref:Protein IN2-1 n=1 Tax=Datura stramonium TaxID=4076 RepID=A0ABS8VRA8_DATST|nr:Protein IN2-1 [Datura stramonium]
MAAKVIREACWEKLEKFDDGPFFLGQSVRLHIAYASFIERFQIFLQEVFNYDITSGRPKLAKWIEELNKLDGVNLKKARSIDVVKLGLISGVLCFVHVKDLKDYALAEDTYSNPIKTYSLGIVYPKISHTTMMCSFDEHHVVQWMRFLLPYQKSRFKAPGYENPLIDECYLNGPFTHGIPTVEIQCEYLTLDGKPKKKTIKI